MVARRSRLTGGVLGVLGPAPEFDAAQPSGGSAAARFVGVPYDNR